VRSLQPLIRRAAMHPVADRTESILESLSLRCGVSIGRGL
jgi:hypothetical protein